MRALLLLHFFNCRIIIQNDTVLTVMVCMNECEIPIIKLLILGTFLHLNSDC